MLAPEMKIKLHSERDNEKKHDIRALSSNIFVQIQNLELPNS